MVLNLSGKCRTQVKNSHLVHTHLLLLTLRRFSENILLYKRYLEWWEFVRKVLLNYHEDTEEVASKDPRIRLRNRNLEWPKNRRPFQSWLVFHEFSTSMSCDRLLIIHWNWNCHCLRISLILVSNHWKSTSVMWRILFFFLYKNMY